MARVAIGIDVVDIAQVDSSVRRFGTRYLERVYTPGELAYAASSPSQEAARLAARFAAKEAVIKLLRPTKTAIPWQSIEVRRNPSGACDAHLSGVARAVADAAGIHEIAISLTHEGGIAAAVASAIVTPESAVEPTGSHGRISDH